jgi:hypothetical protein
MPGPVSDSYDPEFGTGEKAAEIRDALKAVYDLISDQLGKKQPMYILDLIEADLPNRVDPDLTEKECRLIRFAIERAIEAI